MGGGRLIEGCNRRLDLGHKLFFLFLLFTILICFYTSCNSIFDCLVCEFRIICILCVVKKNNPHVASMGV